jgi:hypothetical protein
MGKIRRNSVIPAIVAIIVVAAVIAASLALTGTKSEPGTPSIKIQSFSVNKHNVLVNASVNVTMTVTNEGTARGEKTLDLLLNGALNQSKNVTLEAGTSQTVTFTVRSSIIGNQILSCGENSSYFTSYPRWRVGDYMVYRFDSRLEGTTNMTLTVVGIDGSSVTVNRSYDALRPNETAVIDSNWGNRISLLNNISMEGKIVVPTCYGDMLLSHYNRTEPGPMYDIYMDEPSLVTFKQVTDAWPFVISEELIGTNMPWVEDLARS